MKFEFTLSREDYQKLRLASMYGHFDHEFTQNGTKVTVKTKRPQALVQDLEKLFDSGETSWSEILGVQ